MSIASPICAFALTLLSTVALAQDSPPQPPPPAATGSDQASPPEPTDAKPSAEKIGQMLKNFDPLITWKIGPCENAIGPLARIKLPEGFVITEKNGTKRFLEQNENLVSGAELATVLSLDGEFWFACFEYEDSGHVKDGDKDKLDPDDLLEQKQEVMKEANKERRKRGFPELNVLGWSVPPHYDDVTHNLEWGVRLGAPEGETINYEVRLLSRVGIMQTTLVCAKEQFDDALPKFRKLIADFSFVPGQRYDEVKPGDPIADATLTTLIAGGTAVALWKLGILKYLKGILVAVAAAVAGIWRTLTGRSKRKKALEGQAPWARPPASGPPKPPRT